MKKLIQFLTYGFVSALFMLPQFGMGQFISPTNVRTSGSMPCAICTPDNWFNFGGTPDMSNRTTAATNATSGGGPNWTNSPLVLPPNNHTNWITIRDIGPGIEESVGTNITGLTIGYEYELVAYTMSSVTSGSGSYSRDYIDRFDYQLGTSPRVTVTDINRDTDGEWGVSRLKFIANASTMQFAFFPGNDASSRMESLNISVSLNAINTIPVAQPKSGTTTQGNLVTIPNVISDAVEYDAGQQVVNTSIDLDPNTPGIQSLLTVPGQGTWSVNHTTGDVTFTPLSTFIGTATIPYTVQDNYILDGNPSPGTSTPKNISVEVTAGPVDLDTDNDGIPDCVEKRLDGATMDDLFVMAGNATEMSSDPNAIRLTQSTGDQAGSSWSKDRINFAESFTMRYQAYLGESDGADGIASVFHNDPRGHATTGATGFGIGAAGIENGIALEIDTYDNNQGNTAADGSRTGDIPQNHGMIWDTDRETFANSTFNGHN